MCIRQRNENAIDATISANVTFNSAHLYGNAYAVCVRALTKCNK